MMNADELHQLCLDFRYDGRETDDEIVARIQADVDEYKSTYYREPVPQLPPEPLATLLPLMGWLIYEASWYSLRRVRAAFESMSPGEREPSERAYRQIRRLATAARGLVWPEFAPRALGAIRAQALAESKRDTEDGYDDAYIVHQEAADKHESFLDSHRGSPDDVRTRFELDLDEMLLQLALAETGTACRTAERVIGRWTEEFDTPDNGDDEAQWVQKMYRQLSEAIEIGNRALATAAKIRKDPGLAEKVDQSRLALVTGYRNPGIMTARAALLALALAPAMEHLGRHPSRFPTWAAERADLLTRFTAGYRAIETPVTNADGTAVPMVIDHQRALVQLRLQLALLVPGWSLPSVEPFDKCLEPDPLDDDAVATLSRWLTDDTNASEGGPNHGNTMGAATMPLFIRSVLALRSLTGDPRGYPIWRDRWPELARYYREPGRDERIRLATAKALLEPSLRVGRE